MREIIEKYRHVVIQIATPYNTGTGFYLRNADLIITNEHVITNNRQVVIEGWSFSKQMSDVLYADPKLDLAFIRPPKEHKMPDVELGLDDDLKEGDKVIAIGHPFGLKYTATQGIVSNLLHKQGDIHYIQHDAALNPGNSGGPLVNEHGHIVGLNTFIIKEGQSIGFSLPIQYLHDTIEEFKEGTGKTAVRCNSCANVVFDGEDNNQYCPICGSKITYPGSQEDYRPAGLNKTIEKMLISMEYDVPLARRGPNNWEIDHGSARINISYHAPSGIISGDVFLCHLPKKDILPVYEFMLKENYKLQGLTLSVWGQDIVLSLLIYDKYLNSEIARKLFSSLFEKADQYDDQLINNFGAIERERDD